MPIDATTGAFAPKTAALGQPPAVARTTPVCLLRWRAYHLGRATTVGVVDSGTSLHFASRMW